MAAPRGFSPEDDAPVFVISVAATLAGLHAQTLRQYDRLGLVTPSRTRGGGRRYSGRDVALLREVQRLSQEEGVNLEGIRRILGLENQVAALQNRVRELEAEVAVVRVGEGGRGMGGADRSAVHDRQASGFARQSPDLPPVLLTSRTSPITIALSTALAMSYTVSAAMVAANSASISTPVWAVVSTDASIVTAVSPTESSTAIAERGSG